MNGGFDVKSLLSFEKLIAPTVIKIVYFLGLAGITLVSVIGFLSSFGMMQLSLSLGLWQMVISIFGFAFGILIWRIVTEIYTVFFGIYDRLGEIRDRLPPR